MKKLLLSLVAMGLISVFANTSSQARDWDACPFPLTLKQCQE